MNNYPMLGMCGSCMYNMCCPMMQGTMNMVPGMYPISPITPPTDMNFPMTPMARINMEEDMLLPNMNLMREIMNDTIDEKDLDISKKETLSRDHNLKEDKENTPKDEDITTNADNIELAENHADENTLTRNETHIPETNLYCYTLVNNLNCVFNELMLWTEISSEHPIFIKTVASLTKKNLPKEIENRLMEVNKMFSNLHMKVQDLRKRVTSSSLQLPYIVMELNKIMKEFFKYDNYFLKLLADLIKYGREDKIWQALLHHIMHEQKFMYELFQNIDKQV